jgi:outer membrane immunogenic protein
MRWLVLGVLAVVGVSSVADAQEPRKWTGCYLGGHLGGAFGQEAWSTDSSDKSFVGLLAGVPSSIGSHTPTGGLVGVQVGCDYQVHSNFVVGGQGDFSWSRLSGGHSETDAHTFGVTNDITFFAGTSRVDRLATMTGRIGYASDKALFYIKGGAAWSHDSYNLHIDDVGIAGVTRSTLDFSTTADRWGWTAGAGFEYALWKNVSAFVEYDYLDFGAASVSLSCTSAISMPPGLSCSGKLPALLDINQQINQVKLGLNVRF